MIGPRGRKLREIIGVDPEAWLRAVLRRPVGACRVLAPGPGARSHLFLVTSGAARWVVKVRADPRDAAEREAWALSRAPEGVAPRLIAHVPSAPPFGGCVVMEALEPAGRSRDATRIAGVVARLHQATPRAGPPLACPADPPSLVMLAEAIARDVRGLNAMVRPALHAARSHVARLDPRSWRRPVRRLCHGDLSFHNALGGRLVDFELAGVGDPAVDVALMTVRTPLGKDAERAFLAAYLSGRADPTLVARYTAILPLVALADALSGVYRLESERLPTRALETRRARKVGRALDRALRRLGSIAAGR